MDAQEIENEEIIVVIPTIGHKEAHQVYRIKLWMKANDEYLLANGMDFTFLIADDSVDRGIAKLTEDTRFFRHIRGSGGYAKSIKKAILTSGGGDKFIVMDVDHPIEYVETMTQMLDEFDMVIGHELVKNKERLVTNWICRNLLNIDFPHPTCGFMGFNSDVLGFKITERTIHFWMSKSSFDVSHLEWLYMGIKNQLNIGVMPFRPYDDISHNYRLRRSLKWLYDILKLKFYDKMFNWYGRD